MIVCLLLYIEFDCKKGLCNVLLTGGAKAVDHPIFALLQLGDVIVHLISMLMDVDADLLLQAQEEDKACTRSDRNLKKLCELVQCLTWNSFQVVLLKMCTKS